MNCPICGSSNPDGSLYCSGCGSKLESADVNSPVYGAPPTEASTELFKETPPPAPPVYGAPPVYNSPAQPPAYTQYPSQQPPAPYTTQPTPYNAYNVTPVGSKTGDRSKNWAAIFGLILGILSIPCCFVGIMFELAGISYFVTLVFVVLALVFCIIGLKSEKKGSAIAGLVCGGIGLLMTIIVGVVIMQQLQDPNSEIYQIFQDYFNTVG